MEDGYPSPGIERLITRVILAFMPLMLELFLVSFRIKYKVPSWKRTKAILFP
jgi:hypothetical protein